MEPAGPDVLADLLALASEDGPEKLVETDRLLRDLAGSEAVGEAHRTWSDRLRRGLEAGTPAAAPDGETTAETFAMLRRLRPVRPGGV